jgi:hypothetical protein
MKIPYYGKAFRTRWIMSPMFVEEHKQGKIRHRTSRNSSDNIVTINVTYLFFEDKGL